MSDDLLRGVDDPLGTSMAPEGFSAARIFRRFSTMWFESTSEVEDEDGAGTVSAAEFRDSLWCEEGDVTSCRQDGVVFTTLRTVADGSGTPASQCGSFSDRRLSPSLETTTV